MNLSGDLNQNDTGSLMWEDSSRQDNSFHVVVAESGEVLLEGVTIGDGNGFAPANCLDVYRTGASLLNHAH